MLNHHSITKRIISLTLTLLQCYYFNTLGVDYIYTGSVDLTLEVLLCINIYILIPILKYLKRFYNSFSIVSTVYTLIHAVSLLSDSEFDKHSASCQLQSLNVQAGLQVFCIILIIPTQMWQALY